MQLEIHGIDMPSAYPSREENREGISVRRKQGFPEGADRGMHSKGMHRHFQT